MPFQVQSFHWWLVTLGLSPCKTSYDFQNSRFPEAWQIFIINHIVYIVQENWYSRVQCPRHIKQPYYLGTRGKSQPSFYVTDLTSKPFKEQHQTCCINSFHSHPDTASKPQLWHFLPQLQLHLVWIPPMTAKLIETASSHPLQRNQAPVHQLYLLKCLSFPSASLSFKAFKINNPNLFLVHLDLGMVSASCNFYLWQFRFFC